MAETALPPKGTPEPYKAGTNTCIFSFKGVFIYQGLGARTLLSVVSVACVTCVFITAGPDKSCAPRGSPKGRGGAGVTVRDAATGHRDSLVGAEKGCTPVPKK